MANHTSGVALILRRNACGGTSTLARVVTSIPHRMLFLLTDNRSYCPKPAPPPSPLILGEIPRLNLVTSIISPVSKSVVFSQGLHGYFVQSTRPSISMKNRHNVCLTPPCESYDTYPLMAQREWPFLSDNHVEKINCLEKSASSVRHFSFENTIAAVYCSKSPAYSLRMIPSDAFRGKGSTHWVAGIRAFSMQVPNQEASSKSSFLKKVYKVNASILLFPYRATVYLLKGLTKIFFQICKNPRIVLKWWRSSREYLTHTVLWARTGCKLFYANFRVSYQLVRKKILGHPLRLREHKLLVRTTSDTLKLIPFSLFFIVPFAEFAAPFVIRLFPNMLPSTFIEKQYDSGNLQRKLKAKKELAGFFQELIHERTRQILEVNPEKSIRDRAELLEDFQRKNLQKEDTDTDPFLSLKDTLRFAKLFKSEFVMEKMSLRTLQVMCRLLGLEPYGIHTHVVLQLRHHLVHIQREDRDILWEGVENLSHEELIEACKDRGMRFYDISDESMRAQMTQWLEFSSHRDIPPILLLWSRCITMTHEPMKFQDVTSIETLEEQEEDASKEFAAAELEMAEKRVQELKLEEEDLKTTIVKLQEERQRQEQETTSSFDSSRSKSVADKQASVLATDFQPMSETTGNSRIPSSEISNESALFHTLESQVESVRANKESLIRLARKMAAELKLLRSVSDLQHEQLLVAAKLFSNFPTSLSSPLGRTTEDIALLEAFENGLQEIEALLVVAKNQRHEEHFDRLFYPSDQSDTDDTFELMDEKSNSSSTKNNTPRHSDAEKQKASSETFIDQNKISPKSNFALENNGEERLYETKENSAVHV
ncbi:LETM1 family protein [Cardiosporidium cionae]|uniref:LETM1 family protein n=1 Tax=Cardiosporidium cionae TaxID=476202 RepID=A0ABQ7JEE1_9APIC|nr:LETM1 family protein [Cardiosporidium cionae]|eukprot:KAF8822333.1 LETM1 family protein [Cardiosporidium cionae]